MIVQSVNHRFKSKIKKKFDILNKSSQNIF